MDHDAINTLKDHFYDILVYINQNKGSLFLADYDNAVPSYINALERK